MSPIGPDPSTGPPPARGLALVGYRGTGKSTVGRLLAVRLDRPFADADRVLEGRLGRSIRAIFARDGEAAFRDAEEAILRDLTARPGLILATGGGAVLRAANRAALRRLGTVVWLRADPEVIVARLRAGGAADRPALTAAGTLGEVAAVLAAREPLYRAVADWAIDTADRTPEQVADAVLNYWLAAGPGRAEESGGVPGELNGERKSR